VPGMRPGVPQFPGNRFGPGQFNPRP
jgi:hypothetical protein